MKKILSMPIAALLCIALLGACGAAPNGPNPSTDPPPTTSRPAMTTRPDLALQREVEKGGLVLRVDAEYMYLFAGEPFVLTASVTNTTDQDITYCVGSGTPNVHMEISVNITGFADVDVYGKMFNEMNMFATLKAGEAFTETIHFWPGTPRNSRVDDQALQDKDIDWLPAGEYEGTAKFFYCTGTPDDPGETKRLELEFPIILI